MRGSTARHRLRATWLLLVAATLFSVEGVGSLRLDPTRAGLIVLAIALVKVRFVGREFMELRLAPRAMGLALDVWLLLVLSGLGLLYWHGPAWAAQGLLG